MTMVKTGTSEMFSPGFPETILRIKSTSKIQPHAYLTCCLMNIHTLHIQTVKKLYAQTSQIAAKKCDFPY